jgi:hypothetical protein
MAHPTEKNKATQETPTISTDKKGDLLDIGRFVRVTVVGLDAML